MERGNFRTEEENSLRLIKSYFHPQALPPPNESEVKNHPLFNLLQDLSNASEHLMLNHDSAVSSLMLPNDTQELILAYTQAYGEHLHVSTAKNYLLDAQLFVMVQNAHKNLIMLTTRHQKEQQIDPRSSMSISNSPESTNETKAQKKRRVIFDQKTVSLLTEWLDSHRRNPYPSQLEKKRLMEETGLNFCQLTKWFNNTRSRKYPELVRKKGI